jgi:hypothetical protein
VQLLRSIGYVRVRRIALTTPAELDRDKVDPVGKFSAKVRKAAFEPSPAKLWKQMGFQRFDHQIVVYRHSSPVRVSGR